MSSAPRIVLAGAGGYGASYLAEIASAEADGRVELAGVCEAAPLSDTAREIVGDRPVSADLAQLLADVRPDIGIVATPIHLHLPMATAVLDAGADLVVEKPPAATYADWRTLLAHPGSPRRQVGFQSLGSAGLAELRRLIVSGHLGEIEHVGGWGAWSRPDSYYDRAAWAGRRMLDGQPVSDGTFTNPFAHAVQTALAAVDRLDPDDVVVEEIELWRMREIDCDDTAWLRAGLRGGIDLVLAATLGADVEEEPRIVVRGTRGSAVLTYTEDVLEVDGVQHRFGRTSPLGNLLDHRDGLAELQSPLAGCGAFMRIFEALRLAPDADRIPETAISAVGADPVRTVPGLGEVVRRAAVEGLGLVEAGRPW